MFKYLALLFSFTTLLIDFSHATGKTESENLNYKNIQLSPMSTEIQNELVAFFKTQDLFPVFLSRKGSRRLKINFIFSDSFLSSKVMVKYDIKGNFKLKKLYQMEDYYLYHISFNQKKMAIYFKDMKRERVLSLLKKLNQSSLVSKKNNNIKSNFSLLKSAYANSTKGNKNSELCARDLSFDIKTKLIDTKVADKSIGSLLAKCSSGVGDGVYDSTFGMVEDVIDIAGKAGRFLKKETLEFWKNPSKKASEYWGFVEGAAKELYRFHVMIGELIMTPEKAKAKMKQAYGEIGDFFTRVYDGIAQMETGQKVEIICNILASIGVDALITALTAGSGGAKLAATMTKLLSKLTKIAKMLGKGLKISYKVLERFTKIEIKKIDSIINSGNLNKLHKQLKGTGCAF